MLSAVVFFFVDGDLSSLSFWFSSENESDSS